MRCIKHMCKCTHMCAGVCDVGSADLKLIMHEVYSFCCAVNLLP